MRILHLKVDIESLEQRALGVPQREARVFKVDIGRDLVALRGDEFALELEQVVRGRHADAEADLLVAQGFLGEEDRLLGRLHALDVTTGAEMFGGPKEVTGSFPGIGDNSSNGRVIFDPAQYKERAALLLLNGVVYTTWASHCDNRPYTGWVMGYDQTTLAQTSVLNVVPNGSSGAIWMSDTGPSADSAGNIYLLDANGDFGSTLNASGFPSNGNYGCPISPMAAETCGICRSGQVKTGTST